MDQTKTVKTILISLFLTVILIDGCNQSPVPKPRGYFRIDFPDKVYTRYDSVCPFIFEYPTYGIITEDEYSKEPCWINIEFKEYKGTIHLSYKEVSGNLDLLIEDAHKLAYKHTVKADAIEENLLENRQKSVYGILYNIRGNAASSIQFFVTDSVSNYLRGALYFSAQPQKDSLAPVIEFFREDVIHLIETLEWKQE